VKKLLTIVYLVLLLHSAAAQITVKGTNQFLSGKTPSSGNVLVFLYPDEAAFVWGQGRAYQKITVKFSTQDYKEIFIAGNILGCYMRSSFYAYDLNSLLQEQNDHKTLSDTRSRIRIIDNISSMIVNHENILYVQNNQLYQYRADQNTSVPVNEVTISGRNYERVYLVYNPVLDGKKKEYDLVNTKMRSLLDSYNQIPGNTKPVESIKTAQGSSRTLDGLYNMVKANLLSQYRFDAGACERYLTLAAVMGKTTEADTVIKNGLQKRPDQPNAALRDYFSAIDKYARLTAPEELTGRKAKIEEEYNSSIQNADIARSGEENIAEIRFIQEEKTAAEELLKWGSSIPGIKSKVADLESKEQSLNSIRFINDYAKNRDAIRKFDISFFYVDTRSDLHANYSAMMEVLNHLDAAYAAKIPGYDSLAVGKLRLDNQRDIITIQRRMAVQGLDDYAKKDAKPGLRIDVSGALVNLKAAKAKYDTALARSKSVRDSGVTAAERKYKTALDAAKKKRDNDISMVETALKAEIAAENKKINDNFPKLADYLLKRFINDELYRQAQACGKTIDFPHSSYNSKSADYCVIQENEQRIQGFRVQIPLNLDDFIDLKNDSGEKYKLAHPASYYSILSVVPGAVFVVASANEIYAWDLNSINILQNPIPPATISEGIFYLLRSDTNQYVVTKAGSIIRLGISGGRITQSPLAVKVSGDDTVFISTVSGKDEVYILGSSGSINGRASGSIRIGVTQGGAITITAANGQFTIQ
jgi:hypothetical protein